LNKQLQFTRVTEDKISEKSKLLRNLAVQGRMQGTCDFAVLEEKYQHFGKKPEDMEIDDQPFFFMELKVQNQAVLDLFFCSHPI
ncbi:type III toxin-antitoxin system ToxN/AbiQ family toxin, partial [Salmonella enterica]|uniref:type III toxin-antitoxin system ToxN/AbiQ family toxin n=1 Tax=Salmonella enterica TaxID=28901 RepID=UPI00209C3DDF